MRERRGESKSVREKRVREKRYNREGNEFPFLLTSGFLSLSSMSNGGSFLRGLSFSVVNTLSSGSSLSSFGATGVGAGSDRDVISPW